MSIELCFTNDGVVIGDREKHRAVNMNYSEMFRVVHEFLNKCYQCEILTQNDTPVTFQRLKQGDGSPFPILVVYPGGKGHQLKYEDIKGLLLDKPS